MWPSSKKKKPNPSFFSFLPRRYSSLSLDVADGSHPRRSLMSLSLPPQISLPLTLFLVGSLLAAVIPLRQFSLLVADSLCHFLSCQIYCSYSRRNLSPSPRLSAAVVTAHKVRVWFTLGFWLYVFVEFALTKRLLLVFLYVFVYVFWASEITWLIEFIMYISWSCRWNRKPSCICSISVCFCLLG